MQKYITPGQLGDLADKIKDFIEGKSPDIGNLLGSITFAEMNAGEYLTKFGQMSGIRHVTNSSGKFQGVSITGFLYLLGGYELYIGPTGSEGVVDTLESVTANSYGKVPGVSIAVRYYILNSAGLDASVEKGMSPWHVMTLADYSGFRLAEGASGSSCDCNNWIGSLEEYDSIAEKDPSTLYFITE